MNIVIARDSAYGNTAKVAEAMSDALQGSGKARTMRIQDVKPADLEGVDLLIVGSPTQAGRPTKLTDQFLAELPNDVVANAKFAVFDTRFDPKEQKRGLRMLMGVIGYAAPKMASSLRRRGGTLATEPMGFIVNETEGPLRYGELERAARWAQDLAS